MLMLVLQSNPYVFSSPDETLEMRGQNLAGNLGASMRQEWFNWNPHVGFYVPPADYQRLLDRDWPGFQKMMNHQRFSQWAVGA